MIMKKTIIISVLLLCNLIVKAQIAIEKETFRSNSSIMEFNDIVEPNGEAKGIILPILLDSSIAKEGALWVDSSTKKVMYQSGNGKVEMTEASIKEYSLPANGEIGDGITISDDSLLSSTDDSAVLKLESSEKALLLPHVNDVTKDISNPEPGTIAYDVSSKSLAVFNGDYWFFWN
ncbi:hypothetical protein KRX57_00480 [Weeksellaceae bacterium TAE3-ERU29]|nr:hypothetical protein [Weeksellaceae bacterium TAE3-ERU29]